MRKINFLLLLLVSLQGIAQPLERVIPEMLGMDSRRLRCADEAILRAVDNKEIPGAVLAVVYKNKMVHLKAYGNKQTYPTALPMDVNTVFDLASVSKPTSTAISAMILIERGQLRLWDKVNLYIPDFQGNIRVLDLMTHTSGLPPYAPVDSLQKRHGAPNPDALIQYIATCRRDFAPETDFQYSCLNFITLQRIIETITGQSLKEFAQANIFNPLGLAHTGYQPEGETLERVAPTEKQPDGSVLRGVVHDPLARIMNGGISGNAGLFSDANDLAILAAALLNNGEYNGKRILSPQGVKAMRTIPREVRQFGRSLGWDIFSDYASNKGDLLSENTYGHTGYTGTSIVIDPDNELAVILLTNAVHPVDSGKTIRLRAFVANAVAASLNCPQPRVYFPYYYERLDQFETEPAITSDDVVFLGNSLTENGKWNEFFPGQEIVNRGIRGDESLGIYDRLYQILPGKPKKIFLQTGANDVSHDLPVDTIVERITYIIDKILRESPETQLYLQGSLPINESFGRYAKLTGKTAVFPQLSKRLGELAALKGIPFINLFPLFTKQGTSVLRKELTNDGLHLNGEGYAIWVKAISPYLPDPLAETRR
ncbi:MAG: serine hydrolase [Dysgonamonadaceae bacterium]|jgi:CubicO group peptidase (beta-lactamase class C family)/lysophospholipase L1-like esterase|nr:serine hydrolase [Dysgonamonadaceae bacterium]